MNETKALGDIIRDQEYAAAREFIRRRYPDAEIDARGLAEFSLERNEYFRKIAEQAQQIVTAVVNTTVMPPLVVPNFRSHSPNQTVSSGVEGAHEGMSDLTKLRDSLSNYLTFPATYIDCFNCDGIASCTASDSMKQFHCHGCKETLYLCPNAFNHRWSSPLLNEFQHEPIYFGMIGKEWPEGMQPVYVNCVGCQRTRKGWWTPEATAGYYDLKNWPEKTPTSEQIFRYMSKTFGGMNSGGSTRFLCDECAQAYAPGPEPEPEKLNNAQPDEGTDEEYARYEQYLYGYKAHEAKHKMLTFSGWVREERKLALAESSLSQKLDALVAEHADDCKKCDGTGFEHIVRTTIACRSCHGTGKVESSLSSPPPNSRCKVAPNHRYKDFPSACNLGTKDCVVYHTLASPELLPTQLDPI